MQVSIRTMDFDTIEACLNRIHRSLREVINYTLNLGGCELTRCRRFDTIGFSLLVKSVGRRSLCFPRAWTHG
ncbi:hypothetical protein D3C81_1244930 [compost metagenome]